MERDYGYNKWLQEAYEQGSASEQRKMMIYLLTRIVELLEGQGRVRPS